MLSISNYILEKLKLNQYSRIKEKIKSIDFIDFLLNEPSKFGFFKDFSKQNGTEFEVGSCYYIQYRNLTNPFFILMWHLHKYVDQQENKTYYTNIMLTSDNKTDDHIYIYYIVTESNSNNATSGKPVHVVDFYDPDVSISKSEFCSKFKLNNLDLFGKLFIEMLNNLYDCKTSPGRLKNFKDYAKKMKRYISL